MRKRRAVELIPSDSPVGEVAVHEFSETLPVVAFQKMSHLVNDDVLQAMRVFLGELDVEPNMAGLAVAV